MGLRPDERREALAAALARAAGAETVRLGEIRPLSGGAIQENWRVEAEILGGPQAGRHDLVLRADAPSGVPGSLTRAEEFAVLRAAHAAGVRVPEPLWLVTDAEVLGRPFFVMRRVAGEANPRRLVRDPALDPVRGPLVEALGAELARLHAIAPPRPDLAFLPLPAGPVAVARVARYRGWLDALDEPQPVLEWGLSWVERHAPAAGPPVLCHGDYRTGNLLVEDGRLAAILDWEFAGWGERLEDVGWLCARCWRFGAWAREAGGLGPREAFYRGYERQAGLAIDRAAVAVWEVLAAIRWAVIALHQAARHLSGRQPSLELALTGRIVPEMELDILQQIDRAEAGAA